LHEVPAVPFKNPGNYVHVAARLAEELRQHEPHGVVYANQWENLSNGEGHYCSTGPEIWRQTEGSVDAFCCAIGTGGTLSGVGRYLKERNPRVVIAVTDPLGSCMFHHFKHGELRSDGNSITEGIGQGRITANIASAPVDDAFQVTDEEMLPVLFRLLREEGLCLGGSSGINVAGAMQLARQLGPGHTVVTVLADFGQRYMSKLYNPEFLQAKGLPAPDWLEHPGPE
jgi:cysteine synthase A